MEYFNPSQLSALEETRDLLCAFHRDFPTRYEPSVSNALRTGLVVIERSKAIDENRDALALLEEWVHTGECFCMEGVAFRGPCTFCKTHELLNSFSAFSK